MGLGMGEVNFHRKVRGIQPPNPIPVVCREDLESVWPPPHRWTKRLILMMHMTHWDLSSMTEPIKVDKKLAMQALKGLGWDDPIPSEDIEAWK